MKTSWSSIEIPGECNLLFREPNGDLVVGGRWILVRLGAAGWSGRRFSGYTTIEAIDGDAESTWAVGHRKLVASRIGRAFTARDKGLEMKSDYVLDRVKLAPQGVVLLSGWGHLKTGELQRGWFVSRDRGATFESGRWPERATVTLSRGPGPPFLISPRGVHRWIDTDWSEPLPALAGCLVRDIFSFEGAVFALIDHFLHRSTDGGATWVPLSLRIAYPPMQYAIENKVVCNRRGHLLVAGYGNLLARSLDLGSTWETFTIPGAEGQVYSGALVDEDDVEWVGTCDDAWGALWTTGPPPRRFPRGLVQAPPKRRPPRPP